MSDTLVFERVCKSFQRGIASQRVLAGASFAVKSGEVAAVIGDRFGGKSTVLRLAAGIEAPSNGRVRLDGVDLASLSDRDRTVLLSGAIAWCDRGGPGMPVSIRDWIAMRIWVGPLRRRRQASDRAEQALERLGVADCAGRSWPDLSRWEQVQVALARGIVCRPRLLLIDDLLDGLGPLRSQEVGGLLRLIATEFDCAVLVTVSHPDAAVLVHQLMSLEATKLRLLANDEHEKPGKLVVFPGRVQP